MSMENPKNTIRSEDIMDFITKEDLLGELVAFLCERKTKNLLYLYDMIEKPYKHVDVFNDFLHCQQKTTSTDIPTVIR